MPLHLPPDHAERMVLAEEVHARPPEPLETPSRVTYAAVAIAEEDRERELEHLGSLCEGFGVEPPAADSTQIAAALGPVRLKWERHGEFSSYTFSAPGTSAEPFGDPAAAKLPPGWLSHVPGRTMVAAHAELVPAPAGPPDAEFLSARFGDNLVVGAEVGAGNGLAFTDFKVHDDGYSRFLLMHRRFTPHQAGRTMQRLFEIEAYRMMALLALPIARAQLPRIVAVERSLAALTAEMARGDRDDEELLHELTRLAAEIESELAASQFRYGACRAYAELVDRRIAELRERRLSGIQTIEEFMARRLTPAVATCITASQRLHDLSERVDRARGLLSARVDVARERQNQALLESMDRRAKLQSRLQETVEIISVAAVVYYVTGLVGYVARGLDSQEAGIDPDLVVALSIPFVVVAVILVLRRARQRILASHGDDAAG